MTLAPVFAAEYDAISAPTGCLQGTRIEVLKTIIAWCVHSKTALHIYWLAGHAGTGKSAIAKSSSERLVVLEDTLVVTFFASKNSEERRDPLRMLHTIIYQLAYMSTLVRTNVIKVLVAQPKVVQQGLSEQIKLFLLAPLQELTKTHSLLIVIDSLDECLNIQGVKGGSLIRDLVSVLGHLPIKLVVTSRMEQSLNVCFVDFLPRTSNFTRSKEIKCPMTFD
jgi:hypothetical protein